MPFYAYILQSSSTGRTYIGQTSSLRHRLMRHNDPHSNDGWTAAGIPWTLLAGLQVEDRKVAMLLEEKLKSMKNRERILRIIEKQKLPRGWGIEATFVFETE